MLIDTHCHLDFKDFELDRDIVIARAKEDGLGFIINVGSSMEGTKKSLELAKGHELIYAAIGIHPHEADAVKDGDLESFKKFFGGKKIAAVGEIGLDYHKAVSSEGNQKKLFTKLLQMAKENSLPVIIHNRGADSDIIPMLKEIVGEPVKGVMHCFSGDMAFLKKCLDMGLLISFTCSLTFKNAGNLRELAKFAPLDRLLLETDAPFLAPQVFRGKRNEPGYVKYLALEIARIKALGFDEVANATTENARKLFNLKMAA